MNRLHIATTHPFALARRARRALGIMVLAATAGCGADTAADAEASLLTTDAGDVDAPVLTATGLDYTVTSDDYRRWLAAESALTAVGARELSERIPLEAVTGEDIERITESLEDDARIRAAIEGAGLSVSRYVNTTVALEQALAAASPDSRVQFRQLPAENIIVADRYGADIARVRTASPLRIVDTDRVRRTREWDDDSDDRDGRQQRGRKKGKGHGKRKHKD